MGRKALLGSPNQPNLKELLSLANLRTTTTTILRGSMV